MIYSDSWSGVPTNNSSLCNSFNLDKNNYEELAKVIVSKLIENRSVFMNIQMPNEHMQLDIIMSVGFYNQGSHQRGIRSRDLIIGIISFGCYGFEIGSYNETTQNYYNEKLSMCTSSLTLLFNKIRDLLYNSYEVSTWSE